MKESDVRGFWSFLIGAVVVNEGVFNGPFSEFEPAVRDVKVCINLAIFAAEICSVGEKIAPDSAGSCASRFEFDI